MNTFKSRKACREFCAQNPGYIVEDHGLRCEGNRWEAKYMEEEATIAALEETKNTQQDLYAILTSITHGDQTIPTVVAVFDNQGLAFSIAHSLLTKTGTTHQVVQLPRVNFLHDAYFKALMQETPEAK